MKSFSLIFCLAVLSLVSSAQQHRKRHVLFLGNSYTTVNNLPQLIKDIALANGDTLLFDSNSPGGQTFMGHFTDVTSISKINSTAWDCVVLQAQSQEPSFSPAQVNSQTLPYAIKLDSVINRNNDCTETIFYETWGRKNGDSFNCGAYPPICTYTGMQNRLRASYKLFADTTHSFLSPVGEAFRKSIALNPTLELYQSDQSHPSIEGSYLAACVFYEFIFNRSVLTNSYTAGISNGTTSSFLQQVAHDVVNDSLLTWNRGKYQACVATKLTNNTKPLLNLFVFPNPAGDVLNISSEVNYTIADVLGNSCLSGTKSKTINIEALKNGIYFIELSAENASKKIKFVKN